MSMSTAMALVLMQKSRKKASMVVKGKGFNCKHRRISESSWSLPKEKEEEVVEKSVYLCSDTYDKSTRVTDWYAIRLSSKDCNLKERKTGAGGGGGGEKEFYIEPILSKSSITWFSCCVALGSTIYCIASTPLVSNDVLACDTTKMPMEWLPVAAMNLKREARFTRAVTADGKIFVFGGLDTSFNAEYIDEKFLCEVFDPSKNMWEAIAPPPLKFRVLVRYPLFAVYDDTSRRIIFGSLIGGFLLAYDLTSAYWDTLSPMFPSENIRTVFTSKPVLIDKTLYWIKIVEGNMFASGLYAYHLNLKTLLYGPIVGLTNHVFWDIYASMELLHFRGDEFYLIWHDCPYRVRCDRLQISKKEGDMEKQEGSLTCYVLSTKPYVFGDRKPSSISAVML